MCGAVSYMASLDKELTKGFAGAAAGYGALFAGLI